MPQNKSHKNLLIRKVSGEDELFLDEKLKRSLLNTGASHKLANYVVSEIHNWIKPGYTTSMIFRMAESLLEKKNSVCAIRYRLKNAMLEMGPSGYPFEILMGLLFEEDGFNCEVGIIMNGKCITHEMDVIATRNSEKYLVECKYHKDQDKNVSIQVPLYVNSRVNDIVDVLKKEEPYKKFTFTPWVITNTRFSTDSIDYSKCNGIELLSWNYPEGRGLKELLHKHKLYPITILNSISFQDKDALLEKGIVSVKQLFNNKSLYQDLNFSEHKINAVDSELDKLMNE